MALLTTNLTAVKTPLARMPSARSPWPYAYARLGTQLPRLLFGGLLCATLFGCQALELRRDATGDITASGQSSSQLQAKPLADNGYSFRYQSAHEQAFVEQLLAGMSLEQKVAQMVQAEINTVTPAEAARFGLGSVLNGGGSFPYDNLYAKRSEWIRLANEFYQANAEPTATKTTSRAASIPLLWGTDAVHGHNNVYGATLFPHNIGLGAANNPALTEQLFAATARDVRSTGIKWAFAPTVAVAQDLRWGRTYESFSSDPEVVASLGEAAVRGLQGGSTESLGESDRVIATAKHFIGDGGTERGKDQGNTVLSEAELLATHGLSFQRAIDAGAQTVMASFNSWNGTKLHQHRYLLQDVLKGRMGFDGFVIGDWNAHAQIPGCSRARCPAAFNAGVDMLMAPADWRSLIENTIDDAKHGHISLARINDANRRILSVKYRAGLFAPDYAKQQSLSDADLASMDHQHRQLARQAVRESLVLLKNNAHALPLAANSRLLLIGDAANSVAQQSGGWSLSWQGDGTSNTDFPGASTLRSAFADTLHKRGGSLRYLSDSEAAELAVESVHNGEIVAHSALQKALADVDAVVFAYGEAPYAEGAGDRSNLRPPNRLSHLPALMQAIRAEGLKVSSVFYSGRPMSSNALINASDAFVAAWLPGTEAVGISDLMLADNPQRPRFDFSGRLPFAWPATAKAANSQSPMQFPRGYGLTYSRPSKLAQLPEEPSVDTLIQHLVDGVLPIFRKQVSEPWSMYIGDEDNWAIDVNGNTASTEADINASLSAGEASTADAAALTVSATDNLTQEDARKLRWSALRYAQFYFQHQQGVDISELANKNAALTFKLKVDDPPESKVDLRMDCHYPCMGAIDFTGFLRDMPRHRWQTVSVDLACFQQRGAKLNSINTPFLLGTSGKLSIEIADIMINADSDNDPLNADQSMRCGELTAMLEPAATDQ